jgi:hypothetical protein
MPKVRSGNSLAALLVKANQAQEASNTTFQSLVKAVKNVHTPSLTSILRKAESARKRNSATMKNLHQTVLKIAHTPRLFLKKVGGGTRKKQK